jgi:hypothetical protein
MLRVSARKTGQEVDVTALVDPTVNSLIPFGAELLAFVDAVIGEGRDEPISTARTILLDTAGEAATIRAAAVAGNFQMMNRILDAIGVGVRRSGMKLAAELGLLVPQHLRPQS